jgi:hypothetical protein
VLELSWGPLEDAEIVAEKVKGSQTGVFIGSDGRSRRPAAARQRRGLDVRHLHEEDRVEAACDEVPEMSRASAKVGSYSSPSIRPSATRT